MLIKSLNSKLNDFSIQMHYEAKSVIGLVLPAKLMNVSKITKEELITETRRCKSETLTPNKII